MSAATKPSKRIVLTGGPGAGKSVIAQGIARDFPDRFALVPESATQVYHQLGTRWDLLDLPGRRDAQRRMYRLQLEQEARIELANPGRVLLLDRGTVDGAAYWPDGPDAFWHDVGSSLEKELARYDAAIWLETAAAIGAYDGDASNDIRFETHHDAIPAGQVVLKLWSSHPKLTRVTALPDFEDKIRAVESAVLQLL